MVRNVDTVFLHDSNGIRVYAMGFNSGANDNGFIAREVPEIAFCHLASAAVARAEH
ncbi:hypothetical protein D9M72_639950 [compost metagenome]